MNINRVSADTWIELIGGVYIEESQTALESDPGQAGWLTDK
jgi:hypothetical protein